MDTNTNTATHVLIIGDNELGKRIEELHSATCADVAKKIKTLRADTDVTYFFSIDAAREWYNEDEDDLGWLFDDEVRILPCSHNTNGNA